MHRRTQLLGLTVLVAAALLGLWAVSWGPPGGAVAAPAAREGSDEPTRDPLDLVAPADQRAAERVAEVAEQEPREVPAAGTAPNEISLKDLPPATSALAEGAIEVHVYQGGEPALATVELARYRQRVVMAEHYSAPSDTLASQATDARGVARFEGLEPGDYALRAELQEGAALESTTKLRAGAPGELVYVLFGEGGIRGGAYDDDGTPREGSRIVLAAYLLPMRIETVTDRGGQYAFGGLRSGIYWVKEYPEGERARLDPREVRIELAAGEWKTVDFGGPAPLARWTGALRLADGTHAAGPARVTLTALGRGEETALEVDAAGEFEVALQPGRYTARLRGLDEALELAAVEIGLADLHRDLLVPGTQVSGLVEYLGTGEHGAWSARTCQVWLKSVDEPHRRTFARIRHEGRFAFLGVPPGDYELSLYTGLPRSSEDSAKRLTVHANRARVELDLELRDP